MHQDGASLAALIGSRICHDLINPIGAISNGLELVGMGGATADGPEMSLIQQSCDNATARIRFFRIAFGSSGDARMIPAQEAARTLADHYQGTRFQTEWRRDAEIGRNLVQLAYLAVLCLENALPQGGVLAVDAQDTSLSVEGRSEIVRTEQPLWDMLVAGSDAPSELRPADVQFALLSRLCQDHRIEPTLTTEDGCARLTLALPAANG